MKKTDYIIAGQGIAGSVLALTLILRGHRVVVMDDESRQKSSLVAAGIFNPVTGSKMVKTWKALDLWPKMTGFYREIEKISNEKLIYHVTQFRPFLGKNEYISYANGDAEERFEQFAGDITDSSPDPDTISAPYGGLFVKQTGYLDIPKFIKVAREIIQQKGKYINKPITEKDIIFQTESVEISNYEAKKIIFCEGWYNLNNHFFHWLPFSPVRGDILHFRNSINLQIMVNRGVFVLPHHNGLVKVGSTYDHKNLNFVPDENAKSKLNGKLKGLINMPMELKEHFAGVRPATKDRKPIVGLHPKNKKIGVFNGLGTKGVSLAPYFADKFVDFIENKGFIEQDVKIERFYSLYLNS